MPYFDHNATTPLLLPQARQAWLEASESLIGNPSSPHRLGARAEAALQSARESLARHLGCDALDLVWTSGATESNNMVFHHFARELPADGEVWLSALEHPCVIEAARRYFFKRHRFIPSLPSGIIDLNWLTFELQRTRPGVIAVMAANNETGVLQPWREVLSLCRERQVPFFCDAAQWLGKLPSRGLGDCDFVSGCAHKFGGPKGVGFLKCPSRGRVHPLLVGGPQEEGRRAGTENVAGIVAMLAAFEAREAALATADLPLITTLRDDFEAILAAEIPGCIFVGSRRGRLWNTSSVLMPLSNPPQRWVVKLDKLGIAVSTGSACASGKEKPSHVLSAMGIDACAASRALRFSSGWETTVADWQSLLDALMAIAGWR